MPYLAGPPSEVQAIRFPSKTRVLGVTVADSTAAVDLSKDVEQQAGGILVGSIIQSAEEEGATEHRQTAVQGAATKG